MIPREKLMAIVEKFDTNYYIKNAQRESMIGRIEVLLQEVVQTREDKIEELTNESLWSFIKRRYF